MPITLKPYKDQIAALSGTACDSFEVAQLAGVTDIIENLPNYAVLSVADLPCASGNTGRIVYIENLCTYYYSNGVSWTTCFNPPAPPTGTFAYGWGVSNFGQVGDGTTNSQSSPVSVVGGFCDWLQIESGIGSTIGLRADGTVWTWGSNEVGALGNGVGGFTGGPGYDQSSPVSVVGGFTDWCYVSINGFSCSTAVDKAAAIRTNGTLWTWGADLGRGSLGTGWTVYSFVATSPVSVVGGFTDWTKVAVGAAHMLGLRANGSLWSWGQNYSGELGINSIYNQSSPVSVVGGFTDWCAVAAGGGNTSSNFSAGIRTNGTLWTWGTNGYGALGNNSGVGGNCICNAYDQSSPVSVVGGFTDWCAVSLGQLHAMAIRTNGTLWTWGRNQLNAGYFPMGTLGDNTTADRSSPVSVVGGFTDWCAVAAGGAQSFAVRTNGTLWAWGLGFGGYGIYLPIVNGGDPVSSPVSALGIFDDWCSVSGNKAIFGGAAALRQLT